MSESSTVRVAVPKDTALGERRVALLPDARTPGCARHAACHRLRDGGDPRTSRAQAMDALSSQATLARYKAAILAAEHATRLFPMSPLALVPAPVAA